jgi:hypothetical protein
MANLNNPNGFSPVKSLIGGSFPGQGNLYAIPTDAANTYAIGDVVMSLAGSDVNGVRNVIKWGGATTTSALPLGIITGFATPPVGLSLQGTPLALERQWLPLSSGTQYVYVADDPFLIFEAQFDATGATQAQLSLNAAVTIVADNTATLSTASPLSKIVLTAPAVTATLPIRLLGAVQRSDNAVTSAASPYVRVLCKWNYHEYGATAGASGTVVSYLAS